MITYIKTAEYSCEIKMVGNEARWRQRDREILGGLEEGEK
jgi:hypothetical protein